MRAGFVASAVGHLAILAWGLVALPGIERFEVTIQEAVPVEMVTLSDVTRNRKGERDGEQSEIARARPAEKPAEKPADAEKPAKEPVRKVAATPPPAPAPAPEPTPAREPAPAPQAEPAPPKEPEPEAEAPKPEPEPAPQPVKVTPRTKPTPPEPLKVAAASPQTTETVDKPKKDFDPNNIAALLNKVEPKGAAGEAGPEPASLGSNRSQETGALSASDQDLLIAKIKQRFSYYGDDYPDDLKITIQFSLSEDGHVVGTPEVLNSHDHPKFSVLARAAVRAVLRVDQEESFAFLPRDKFGGAGGWSTLVVNFYPKQS